MNNDEITRRLFLLRSSAGLSAAWLASRMQEIVAAQEHAHRVAASAAPPRFEFFTPEQAEEVEAIAAQIIPTDETPGAREAQAIYFIDRALMTFDSDKKKVYNEGLALVRRKTRKMKGGRFGGLTAQQQIKLLKSIEKTEFFELVRTHTIMGVFANPEHGGNRDQIGWKMIGFEDSFSYEPPFGYYDHGHKED
jgi:gluconate 2-dehydrogenase gamma chain